MGRKAERGLLSSSINEKFFAQKPEQLHPTGETESPEVTVAGCNLNLVCQTLHVYRVHDRL